MPPIKPVDPGDAELPFALEEVLTNALRRPVEIRSLKRKPSPYTTLFPAEIVSLSLKKGEKVSLFLKHLGSEQADHPDKQCRDREIRIYEELLRDKHLPVVKYYGSRWNRTTERRELFLEYVDAWNLKYHGIEHWLTAAQRLAHLHAYFASQAERLLACEYLLRFDAIYFCEWAHRALSAVVQQSEELAATLEPVVNNYDRVAEVLMQQPVTLVHNDLSPRNVIADRSSSPARICFIDWEMAGIGSGLLDLVHLKYGLERADDQRMRSAYARELAGTALLPSKSEDLDRLFAACEVHKIIYRLARSKTWNLPIERVAGWVADARHFLSIAFHTTGAI
jgi:thiamine kinase-like enzyme